MRRKAGFLAVAVVLIAGVICAILRYTGKITSAPWDALTVALIAGGAVGAVVLAIFHAYHLEGVETEEAERLKRQRRRRRTRS
jgi:lipoprotein signal peptidase